MEGSLNECFVEWQERKKDAIRVLMEYELRYIDDGAFKPLYELNNPKGYKTFGIRKKNIHRFFFLKKVKCRV